MSTKVNVSIRIDKDTKELASHLAQTMGTNLSTILNMYLVQFTRDKKLEIHVDDDYELFELDNKYVSEELVSLQKKVLKKDKALFTNI